MKITKRQLRRIIKEAMDADPSGSHDTIAKILDLWNNNRWEQAMSLAHSLGPEISRHSDLKIWQVYSMEDDFYRINNDEAAGDFGLGEVIAKEINFSDATSMPGYKVVEIDDEDFGVGVERIK